MSSSIKNNIIKCTRADSLWTTITLTDADGNEYVPDPNDQIWFALKGSTDDSEEPLVLKKIDPETLELRLDPADNDHPPGTYWYDIEITLTNGFVTTVVGPCKYFITPQVKNVGVISNG